MHSFDNSVATHRVNCLDVGASELWFNIESLAKQEPISDAHGDGTVEAEGGPAMTARRPRDTPL